MNERFYELKRRSGKKQWELAELLGYREDTFSKMLRKELSPEIVDHLKELLEEAEKNAESGS